MGLALTCSPASMGVNTEGVADPAFAAVVDVFSQVLEEHRRPGGTGAALAVWHDDRCG